MKKILIILLLSFGVYTTTSAQTTSAPANATVSKQKDKANKEAIAAQKKTDKQAKALAKKQAKANQSTTQSAPQVQTTTTPATSSVAKVKSQPRVVNPANTAHPADKAISTDAKGRTIYQGPRGGKYYLDKNGNKEYVK